MIFFNLFIFFLVYTQIFINKISGVISEEDENWLLSVLLDSSRIEQDRTTSPQVIQTVPSTTKKRKKSDRTPAERLERRRSQARISKERKKEQSAESLEAFKAKQKEYRRKHLSKIRKDPLKLEEFKERQRIATQKNYMKKKKQDPDGFTEYLRKKNQRARNNRKIQKKTEDIN